MALVRMLSSGKNYLLIIYKKKNEKVKNGKERKKYEVDSNPV